MMTYQESPRAIPTDFPDRLGSAILWLFLLLCLTGLPRQVLAEDMTLPALEIKGRGATLLFSGPSDQPAVALTFDDGPHPVKTARILEILDQKGVPATFFVLGSKVKERPEIVRQILFGGHEVANHTYTHANLKKVGPSTVSKELDRTQDAILEAAGYIPTLFRPPYGATDLTTMAILANLNLTAVYWSIDTRDWEGRSAEQIENEVLENLHNGAIILFHDHAAHTLEALPTLIDEIQGRGFAIRTISELFDLTSPAVPAMLAEGTLAGPKDVTPPAAPPEAVFAAQPLPQPQLAASMPTPEDSPVEPAGLSEPSGPLPKPAGFQPPSPTPPTLETSSPEETVQLAPAPLPGVQAAPPAGEEKSEELPTAAPTSTGTPTLPGTSTPTATVTLTQPLPTATGEPTVTSTATIPPPDPTPTSTRMAATSTSTPVATFTSTSTPVASSTQTKPPEATQTPSPTLTKVPAATPTATHQPTATPTATATATLAPPVVAGAGEGKKAPRQAIRLSSVQKFSEKLEVDRTADPFSEGSVTSTLPTLHPSGYPGPWGYFDKGPILRPPR